MIFFIFILHVHDLDKERPISGKCFSKSSTKVPGSGELFSPILILMVAFEM